ncbi:MAG: GNAT family N-acetyltransferase [Candidatus Hydrogenedentes bacterium]|nr:GNAT family N-acetyltransferase [Candidatus Hydrogenedentota bacterium]
MIISDFQTQHCFIFRATHEHLKAVEAVFADNVDLLRSTACVKDAATLANETVCSVVLPPGGEVANAFPLLIVSKNSDATIGVLEGYVGYPNASCLYIAQLYLSARFQRKGFGREVVSALLEQVVGRGIAESRVSVNVPNWGALWFWARLGFTEVSGIHGAARPGDGAVELRRVLNERRGGERVS